MYSVLYRAQEKPTHQRAVWKGLKLKLPRQALANIATSLPGSQHPLAAARPAISAQARQTHGCFDTLQPARVLSRLVSAPALRH